MSFFFVDPEVYNKYKDQILEMAQSIQVNYVEHMAPEKRKPGYSDEQIAEKLGLDVRVVREIRCVGEREYYGIDEWERPRSLKNVSAGRIRNGVFRPPPKNTWTA